MTFEKYSNRVINIKGYNIMTLYQALNSIFEQYGRDMIEKEVLINYLADYHAYESRATRRVFETLLKLGYGAKIYLLDKQNALDKLLKLKSYGQLLAQEGFQEIHVNYVLDSISYAFGWKDVPPEEITQEKISQSANKRHFYVNGVNFTMIQIDGGSFDIGATPEQGIYAAFDEKPSLHVTIKNFYIGESLVTQKLWQAVMNDNPSHFKGDTLPVERVSWEECNDFIGKLNGITGSTFRLPTEAEWEFAARGGNKTSHTKFAGADDDAMCEVMWFKENSKGQSHEVKSKLANELGLYDMSGNISEWCNDWYFNSYANSGTQINPTGPSFGTTKVYRGGSWNDKSLACRVSKRSNMNPIYRNKLVGLRLAATTL